MSARSRFALGCFTSRHVYVTPQVLEVPPIERATVLGISDDKMFAAGIGLLTSVILGVAIVVGSRNLEQFDTALVGYT